MSQPTPTPVVGNGAAGAAPGPQLIVIDPNTLAALPRGTTVTVTVTRAFAPVAPAVPPPAQVNVISDVYNDNRIRLPWFIVGRRPQVVHQHPVQVTNNEQRILVEQPVREVYDYPFTALFMLLFGIGGAITAWLLLVGVRVGRINTNVTGAFLTTSSVVKNPAWLWALVAAFGALCGLAGYFVASTRPFRRVVSYQPVAIEATAEQVAPLNGGGGA